MSERWTAEQVAQELLAVLPLLNRIMVSAVRHEAGEETTMPQFRVLALLAEAPQTTSALARKRRVSLPTMATLIQSLVERGWVTRIPDPYDRRQHQLQLTDSGLAHYTRAENLALSQLIPLLANLSDQQIEAIQIAIPALHQALTNSEND
jgi:DNA-binding MarR family transcriptional regulator